MKAPILKSAFIIAGLAFLIGCQKDVSELVEDNALDSKAAVNKKTQEHMFKGEFDAYYEVYPDYEAGYEEGDPAPAWYPGGAEGHLTSVGKAGAYFNQYVTFGPTGLLGVAAPIQKYFFAELNEMGITIPGSVGTVGMFFYDKHGNSIWSRVERMGAYVPVSETRFEGKGGYFIIVGGTGKYQNAKGHFYFNAWLDPTNWERAGFEVYDGVLEY